MPMKISCGLSKKIGLPEFGSLGASCHVEFEVEGTLLQNDLDAFHRHVRNAFVACRQAVQDELARQEQAKPTSNAVPSSRIESPPAASTDRNTSTATNGHSHNNGHNNGSSIHRASQKQVDFIQQLARQTRGLGVRRLDSLAEKMFAKPMADLSSMDASGLIDTLKAIKTGEIDLDAVFSGAAS